MKRSYILPVWLWLLQALTGLALVLYVVIHTLDNATILISKELYEDMLRLWHESLPHWFYLIMVAALVIAFAIHTLNGIRIASKPYKEIDKSWRHLTMMKHSGTIFWYLQVFTGSMIAIFGVWHLIVQHTGDPTTTVDQSILRINPSVFIIYVIFAAALTFHSFNGIRSILIKLGFLTDKIKESILVGFLAFLFVVFFLLGAFSLAKFLLAPKPAELNLSTNAAISYYSDYSNPGSSYPGALAEGSCYPGFQIGDVASDPDGEQRI
jgi:succinate dehydrogenase/fumarate reductase cytochrome b subunit